MAETPRQNNRSEVACVLCGFWNLYYHRHIEGGAATGTPLAGGYPRLPPPQIDIGRYRVRANRAVNLTHHLILAECFHNDASPERTPFPLQRLCQNRKVL